jgi:DNA-directed RNA polymerase subunit RPC12/RpoP
MSKFDEIELAVKAPIMCPECKHHLFYEVNGKWYSRVIGLYDRGLDRTVSWRCPDCNHEWERK